MSEEKKSARREALLYEQKNGWELVDDSEKELISGYCERYKAYLDASRTEREAVKAAVDLASTAGFEPYVAGMQLKPGAKIYRVNRGKALMLAVIGSRPLSEGAVISAAHVDAPRLDLKQLPLYEDSEIGFFKTHYYGGVRKYQWVAIPLELRGVVALKDGKTIDVVIGKDKSDPQFVITDLLPHLAADQSKKTLGEAHTGEGLNILVGSIPDKEEGKDRVRLAVMSLLNAKYGITEADFLSAELSATPAFETRDIGLDRSLIGGYGHDDRVCSFASLRAILDIEVPSRSAICILADKEEIGSMGVSGMQSEAFDCFVKDLCESQGAELRRCYEKSVCLSADVCNAFDPNYPEVSEKRNSGKMNYGTAVCKYTGSRGKSGSSDANAELVARLRRVFDENAVVWQMAELGKVDQGGGGTVAAFMANRNIDTIDIGVPVLSMHSPFETVAKLDCYMTYKGIMAVYSGE